MIERANEPPERDAALEALLRMDASDATEMDVAALNSLKRDVQQAVAAEDGRPLAALRHRPTWQRNAICLAALGLHLAASGTPPESQASSPGAFRMVSPECAAVSSSVSARKCTPARRTMLFLPPGLQSASAACPATSLTPAAKRCSLLRTR